MKIAVVVGTRPELVKMSPVLRYLQNRSIPYVFIHTGQHYSENMDKVFFKDLRLPEPKYNLSVGSGTHAETTAHVMVQLEGVLSREKPDMVLVQGDTDSVLASALCAAKLHIPVGHVEAGNRSGDRSMPEELNRIIADHVSDFCFAATHLCRTNLLKEGVPAEKITVTGNTIVDAVKQNLGIAEQKVVPQKRDYILTTFHREENVDNAVRLQGIVDGLKFVSREFSMPVVFPCHPRTKKMMDTFGIPPFDGLEIIEPVGYLDMLVLVSKAKLILSDSGGLQEEACILRVPCVTLRENTERPETIEVGANVLAGTNPVDILRCAKDALIKRKDWLNPFGNGTAGRKIVDEVLRHEQR